MSILAAVDWGKVAETAGDLIVGSGLIAAVVALYWEYRTDRRDRKEKREADKEQLRIRLALFVQEGISLQTKWVQYAGQAGKELSFSVPFELTTPDYVNELILLGAPSRVISAIFRVKSLNANVLSNVQRSQAEWSVVATRQNGIRMVAVENMTPFHSFARATAFINGRWDDVNRAISDILKGAEDHGVDVADYRKKHKENLDKFSTLNLPDPEKSEPAPVTFPRPQ